jgi:hypothetical protein
MGLAQSSTWNAQLEMKAPAEDVLHALTDPDLCCRWSPIDFEVEELDGRRLVAGSRARVTGKLAGAQVSFDVEVFESGPERLVLRASGPLVLDVDYRLAAADDRSTEVTASVSVARARDPGAARGRRPPERRRPDRPRRRGGERAGTGRCMSVYADT